MDAITLALSGEGEGPCPLVLQRWLGLVDDAIVKTLLGDEDCARQALFRAQELGDCILEQVPESRRLRASQWMQLRLYELLVLCGRAQVTTTVNLTR